MLQSSTTSFDTDEQHEATLSQGRCCLSAADELNPWNNPAHIKAGMRAAKSAWEQSQARFRAQSRALNEAIAEVRHRHRVEERERKRLAHEPIKREKARLRQRARRARLAGVHHIVDLDDLLRTLALLDSLTVSIDMQSLVADATAFEAWLSGRGRTQGALRKLERERPGELMLGREVLLVARLELGREPTFAEYAERLTTATGRRWSRHQARRRFAVMAGLEALAGPWARSDTSCAGLGAERDEPCAPLGAKIFTYREKSP